MTNVIPFTPKLATRVEPAASIEIIDYGGAKSRLVLVDGIVPVELAHRIIALCDAYNGARK